VRCLALRCGAGSGVNAPSVRGPTERLEQFTSDTKMPPTPLYIKHSRPIFYQPLMPFVVFRSRRSTSCRWCGLLLQTE